MAMSVALDSEMTYSQIKPCICEVMLMLLPLTVYTILLPAMSLLIFQTGNARLLQNVYRGHLVRLIYRALVYANYRAECTIVI
jgi:hypothetical protein